MRRITILLFMFSLFIIPAFSTSSTTTTNRTTYFINHKDENTNILGAVLVIIGLILVVIAGFDMFR